MVHSLIGGRALVRRLDPEKVTKGGILLADTAQKKSRIAKVLSVGPGRFSERLNREIQFPARVGDTVLIGQHAGVEVQVDGETLVLVCEDEVFAIMERPKS